MLLRGLALGISVVTLFFSAVGSVYAKPVSVVSMILGKGLQEREGPGFYKDIIEAILKRSSFESVLEIHPFRRALSSFSSRQGDCIWALDIPLLNKLQVDTGALLSSSLVLTSSHRIFTLRGSPGTEALRDLKGRKVGVLNGSGITPDLETVSANIVALSSQTAKVDLLFRERLDAIAGWAPDIYVTLASLGHKPEEMRASPYTVRQTDVRIVCHSSDKTREFIESINPVIESFSISQTYRDIARKYGVP